MAPLLNCVYKIKVNNLSLSITTKNIFPNKQTATQVAVNISYTSIAIYLIVSVDVLKTRKEEVKETESVRAVSLARELTNQKLVRTRDLLIKMVYLPSKFFRENFPLVTKFKSLGQEVIS